MSALLATLMVYSNMNNQFEIIAIRMSGVSLYRLAQPALLVGISAAIFTFLLHDYVVPLCNKYSRALKSYAIEQQNLPATQDNFIYKQFDANQQLKRLMYVSHFDGRHLGYSTLIDLTNPETLQVTQARSGDWGQGVIELQDANIYTVASTQKLLNTTSADHLELEQFLRPKAEVAEYLPREMSFVQLYQWLKKGKRESAKDHVALWEKLTVPLSALPLVLIAVPLSLTSPRKLTNLGFLGAIFILFLYYLLRHISVQFGESGTLPPLLAACIPLIVLSSAGIYLFRKKTRIL
jgi:lipopolysaccharide export system permease protein